MCVYVWPPSIKFDHGSTSWLSCLFDCCSVACGCRDLCGGNNLCRKVAFVCGLWSVRVFALLSAGPSSCFCIHQLLFPCLEVSVQGAFPHHAVGCKVLSGTGVDVKRFHVFLADILVAQLWVAFGSPCRCQLSMENVFWDAAILHVVDMPQPTQPALSEQGEHARKVSSGQDLGVGRSVLPGYAKDTADASQVEGTVSFLVSGICGPRLAAVHQFADNTGIVHDHLGLTVSLGFVHTREVRRAFAILLSISVSKEKLSVMVEPRYVNCSTTSSS